MITITKNKIITDFSTMTYSPRKLGEALVSVTQAARMDVNVIPEPGMDPVPLTLERRASLTSKPVWVLNCTVKDERGKDKIVSSVSEDNDLGEGNGLEKTLFGRLMHFAMELGTLNSKTNGTRYTRYKQFFDALVENTSCDLIIGAPRNVGKTYNLIERHKYTQSKGNGRYTSGLFVGSMLDIQRIERGDINKEYDEALIDIDMPMLATNRLIEGQCRAKRRIFVTSNESTIQQLVKYHPNAILAVYPEV